MPEWKRGHKRVTIKIEAVVDADNRYVFIRGDEDEFERIVDQVAALAYDDEPLGLFDVRSVEVIETTDHE